MNGKHTACVNDLVRQVALMMDDCEQHADGRITIDCDISQGFLRRIYDLLIALEDSGYDAIEPQPSVVYQCPRCSTSMQVDETAKPAAVPEAVAKDAKTILGMDHGQVVMLRRADTKDSCGIGAVSAIGTSSYIHRLDGSKIYLGDHIHRDGFTGFFEALAVPALEWPDAAILSATDDEVKNGSQT